MSNATRVAERLPQLSGTHPITYHQGPFQPSPNALLDYFRPNTMIPCYYKETFPRRVVEFITFWSNFIVISVPHNCIYNIFTLMFSVQFSAYSGSDQLGSLTGTRALGGGRALNRERPPRIKQRQQHHHRSAVLVIIT